MSLNRYAKRTDLTAAANVMAMRAVGAHVLILDKFDHLVHYRGQLFMIDSKSPDGRRTTAQQQLVKDGWPLHFCATPEACLRVIGALS